MGSGHETVKQCQHEGVILAGSKGTRLYPLTKVTNKHLLPVRRMRMIFDPLRKMIEAGVDGFLLVISTEHLGGIVQRPFIERP